MSVISVRDAKQMTVKQLRKEVRSAIKEANQRLDTTSRSGQKLIKQLKSIGGSTKGGKITAKLNYKTKAELINQLRTAQRFLDFDKDSTYAKKKERQKQLEKYQTFMDTIGVSDVKYLSLEEFNQLVQSFSINEDILENFGYENITELMVTVAKSPGKTVDLISAMKEVQRQSDRRVDEGFGAYGQTEMMNLLYQQLGVKRD